MTSTDKRGACELIIELATRLPEQVADELAVRIDHIGVTSSHHFDGEVSMGGTTVAFAVALGRTTGDAADEALSGLAVGSVDERRDVARILGRGNCRKQRPILASLAADPSASVRSTAAYAVGRLLAAEPTGSIFALAEHFLGDPGVLLPSAFVAGLSTEDKRSDRAVVLAQELSAHPSAKVRSMVGRIVDGE